MKLRWTIFAGLTLLVVVALFGLFRSGVISIDGRNDDSEAVDESILNSLPYASTVTEPESSKRLLGVTLFDRERAYAGFNLYTNHRHRTSGAYLIDMNGQTAHQWQLGDSSMWKFVTVDPDGDAYAILESTTQEEIADNDRVPSRRLVKLDWDSRVLFEVAGEFHHDIQFRGDGSIVTLDQKLLEITHNQRQLYIKNDYLTFISADGLKLDSISLYDVLQDDPAMTTLLFGLSGRRSAERAADLLHTNTVHIIDNAVEGVGKQGDILLCMRNLNLMVVYDYKADEIVWRLHGAQIWQHPHEPMLLANGNLLVFDNGYAVKWSRIIEIDPLTQQIAWEYYGKPERSFFTKERGSMQPLPNGNMLIVESNAGHAFEITRDGEKVWEWYNPEFHKGERSVVYRMKRLEPQLVQGWLSDHAHTRDP